MLSETPGEALLNSRATAPSSHCTDGHLLLKHIRHLRLSLTVQSLILLVTKITTTE